MYNKRTWLNKQDSPSTGSVVAFDGEVKSENEKYRSTFLSVSDCFNSAKLHKADYDSMEDFIYKMKTLRNVIDSFIEYLETTEK